MILYHGVPRTLQGTKLYPLNQMKELYPDIYHQAVTSYQGREHVCKQVIPLFNCLWNDVVFLSPVHPQQIVDARRKEGLTVRERKWFEIDSEDLDQEMLVLYRHRPPHLVAQQLEMKEYVRFSELSSTEKEELALIPEVGLWSIQKFKEQSLLFGYIPHLLYQGIIDIETVPIITSS